MMGLLAGTKLGPYEIVSPLGAGGMGEVYRARDTRLGRDVAIKVLPAYLSCTLELKARFERETRTISSLNHAHICHLYDVGSQDGTDFLVMELLEGETLAERLHRGPVLLDQVLRIGAEIADALDKAHQQGITHRDLKPGNIMLTKSGAKLMDFGLAKPATAIFQSTGRVFSTAATQTSPASPLTVEGMLVGTLQYMSPEQVEGKEADARSDIFALGAVLYEMIAGRPAFEGKSQVGVVSAILQKEPPPVSSTSTLPTGLDYLIRTCLAKDPEERFQTAHDVKLQLRWLQQSSGIAQPVVRATRWRKILWPIAALATLLAILAILWMSQTRPTRDLYGVTRFTIALGNHSELSVDTTQAVVVSPDGKRLAYVASESGLPHLHVRSLNRFDSVAIPESEGATFPFFSPDGEWIAFFSQGRLKKAPVNGGAPVVVCDLNSFFGGAWTSDGKIIFDDPSMGLGMVPEAGGTPQKIRINQESLNSHSPALPRILPNSPWVVFTNYPGTATQLRVVNVDTGEVRLLLNDAEGGYYSGNRLLYYSGGAVWAIPFDLKSVSGSAPAVPVVMDVDERNFVAQFSAAQTGVLAYAPGVAGNFTRNLFWVDRKGQAQKIDVPANDYVDPSISPDGKRFAVAIRSLSDQQLAVYDAVRGVLMRIPSNGTRNTSPTWTPDGRELVVDASGPNQKHGIYRIAADGSSGPQLIYPLAASGHVTSIAGGHAVIMMTDPVTSTDLWTMELNGKNEPQPFRRTSAMERQGSLSPDGKWMAYASNESGRSEIYVEPVPGPGGRWQISTNGGEQPRWVRTGREIVYRNGTKMMSAAVQIQPTFSAAKPVELFDRKFDRGGTVGGYDITPDGQTFVMTRSEQANPTEIRVVVGWSADQLTQK